jgi:hypothetical protein
MGGKGPLKRPRGGSERDLGGVWALRGAAAAPCVYVCGGVGGVGGLGNPSFQAVLNARFRKGLQGAFSITPVNHPRPGSNLRAGRFLLLMALQPSRLGLDRNLLNRDSRA